MVKINCSKDAFNEIKSEFDDFQEKVYIIGVDTNNQFKYKKLINMGDVNVSIISAKVIFRDLLVNKCFRFFLFHNHPSRNVKPSIDDIKATETLKKQSEIMDIQFLDHIIFSDKEFYSMFDNSEGGFC